MIGTFDILGGTTNKAFSMIPNKKFWSCCHGSGKYPSGLIFFLTNNLIL